jgi:anti-anti-sigma factor
MSPAHTQDPEPGAIPRLALIPQQTDVTTVADGESFIIAIRGEIDLASVGAFEDAARRALAANAPQIVVDLGACRFMDSTGLGALIRLNRRVTRDVGRDLLILPGPRAVQRAIEVSGLIDVLPFPEE